jgi:superfamily II DNA or RNA helicase
MTYLEVHSVWTYAYNVWYGDTTEAAIQAQTFYYVPNHETDERFMANVWDGREQLFVRTLDSMGRACHKVMTGLVGLVTSILNVRQEPYEIVNCVPKWERDPSMAYLASAPLSVRPYQTQAAMSVFGKARMGGVIQAATGAGKTRIAAKTIQLLQVPTVFYVDQIELLEQVADEFESMLGCKIGRVGGGHHDIRDITVCTIQTVALAAGDSKEATAADKKIDHVRLAEILYMVQCARLVIVDECHGVAARTARTAVMAAANMTACVGLSASPWRDDGTDILIEACCGAVCYRITASELIEMGWLVQPTIFVHKMPMPSDALFKHSDASEFHKLYKAWVVEDEKRNDYVALLANDHVSRGHVVIVLVKYVEHGKKLAQLVPHSVFMHGTLSKKKRKDILVNVKSGETRVLIATSLADKGLDIPIAAALVLAGGGKSSTKALQRIGRVLRKADGKTQAFIHDIVDEHSSLKRHYHERMKIYRTEPKFLIQEQRVA